MAFPATVMENPQRKCADHGKIILDRHSDEKVNSAQIFGKYPPPTCLIDVRILGKVYVRIIDPIGWAKRYLQNSVQTSQVMWNDFI